jgi:peptidoglycan/LPS O-acetylase OafA/YrhL
MSSGSTEPTKQDFHPAYRPDIDGLRALAILPVVAFHAFPVWVKGGFVGVDIFFVISGFLISSIIFHNISKNYFSFTRFYARRINRIFPALLLVMTFCYVLGWVTLFPDEFKQLGKHIAAGAGFVQNFVLLNEAGYFDTASELKPLMHLWSLAIEEQFYLIYPLLIWIAWRSKLNIYITVFTLGSISIALNLNNIHHDAVTTFFAPQTRFWELMAGALLAYFFTSEPDTNPRATIHQRIPLLANCFSTIGLLLMCAAVFGLNRDMPYPGTRALIPVTGAFLLILGGPTAWVNRKILASPMLVWIGLISYPLYLWHWPLLSFARIIEIETPSRGTRITVVAISFVLAWLTYQFIERPIRNDNVKGRKTLFLCMLTLLLGCIGYYTYQHNGLGFRFKDRESYLAYFYKSDLSDWQYFQESGLMETHQSRCSFRRVDNARVTNIALDAIAPSCYQRDPDKNKALMLWGDSHARQLRYGLAKNLPPNWQILMISTWGCAPNIELENSITNACIKSNWFALKTIKETPPDIVLIAQESGHSAKKMQILAHTLKKMGVRKIIFTGPTPHWNMDLPKIISKPLWLYTPKYSKTLLNIDNLNANSHLKSEFKQSSSAIFVDIIDLFCNDAGCLTYLGDDRKTGITSWDTNHLTPLASDYFVKERLLSLITHEELK